MLPHSTLRSLVFLLVLSAAARAHPLPDIPVQSSFDAAGAGVVRVEVDLRFFDAEPATAPYFKNEFLPDKTPAWKTGTIEKARAFVATNIEFFLDPGGLAAPEWQWEFTGQKNAPLAQTEDPVVLTGTWRTVAGATGYRIRSKPANPWSVLFLNTLHGKEVERTQVLFPGESSFILNLAAPVPAAAAPATKSSTAPWWRRGFGGA